MIRALFIYLFVGCLVAGHGLLHFISFKFVFQYQKFVALHKAIIVDWLKMEESSTSVKMVFDGEVLDPNSTPDVSYQTECFLVRNNSFSLLLAYYWLF